MSFKILYPEVDDIIYSYTQQLNMQEVMKELIMSSQIHNYGWVTFIIMRSKTNKNAYYKQFNPELMGSCFNDLSYVNSEELYETSAHIYGHKIDKTYTIKFGAQIHLKGEQTPYNYNSYEGVGYSLQYDD